MTTYWQDIPDRNDEWENDQRQWSNQDEQESIDDEEYEEDVDLDEEYHTDYLGNINLQD